MRKSSASLSLFFCLIGLGVFVSMTFIWTHLDETLSKREPYYSAPIDPGNTFLRLRNDAFGKGFFGAHRDGGRTHKGIDILALVGQPVLAAKSGRVAFSGIGKGYGQYIEVCHFDGLRTRYAHLSRLYVRMGDWVAQGDILGACGKTGNAWDPQIKPHLHFEILTPLGAVNPCSGLLDPQTPIQRG